MKIIETLSDLQDWREQAGNLGLVPTMGALHDGHISLVEASQKQCKTTIASIFVNPAQFAPNEDLATYPRTFDEDIAKLTKVGCDAVWVPSIDVMYPDGDMSTDIEPAAVALPLEGEFRPHFFAGVVNVVSRLFNQVKPDIAYFGEKDYQQLQVIKHMVADYNIPVEIVGVPTMRDDNGLALSSRNQYLSSKEYDIAVHLNRVLFAMAEKLREGEQIQDVKAEALVDLQKAGFDSIDYCVVRNANTLLHGSHHPLRILAAAKIGKTRLIDNIAV